MGTTEKYIIFYGEGQYRVFYDKNEAIEFCERHKIVWFDNGAWN